VSEGRDRAALDAIGVAFGAGGGARLLDVHADPDHHRAVFTLAGEQGRLAEALLDGFREAVARIDVCTRTWARSTSRRSCTWTPPGGAPPAPRR